LIYYYIGLLIVCFKIFISTDGVSLYHLQQDDHDARSISMDLRTLSGTEDTYEKTNMYGMQFYKPHQS